jgi:hypothetical protein
VIYKYKVNYFKFALSYLSFPFRGKKQVRE